MSPTSARQSYDCVYLQTFRISVFCLLCVSFFKYSHPLDTVVKPTNTYNHIRVSCIINIVWLLHVKATVVAILREVHYIGYVTKVFEPMHK